MYSVQTCTEVVPSIPAQESIRPANFTCSASPSKMVTGVLRDKDTGKPLAGFTVSGKVSEQNRILTLRGFSVDVCRCTTKTDLVGCFRLDGLPKGADNQIMFAPPADQPYVPALVRVPDTPGLEPVKIDFEMKRGVWVEGKITDRDTGKPIHGASVSYHPPANNPALANFAGNSWAVPYTDQPADTCADGTFRIPAFSGKGVIAVMYYDYSYLSADQTEDGTVGRIEAPEPGPREERFIGTGLGPVSYTHHNAVVVIDAGAGAKPVQCDVKLEAGELVRGRVVGPDGKPLAGAWGYGLAAPGQAWDDHPLSGDQFTISYISRRRPRFIAFSHAEMNLAAVLKLPQDKGQVTVKLMPAAAVTGRLVDTDGKPLAGVSLGVKFVRGQLPVQPNAAVKTNAEGCFRITALVPNVAYQLFAAEEASLAEVRVSADETKDLGDVRATRQE